MSAAVAELLAAALRLSPREREELAGRIRESLTPAEAWSAEVKARLDEVASGAVRPVPWAEARRMILADDDAAG